MWLFGKRRKLTGYFTEGFVDWHSHILPGVDDGVQTLEESLAILREYERCHVRSVWLTPHVMEEIPNTTSFLRECFARLQTAYTGSIQLHLGSENMLDTLFETRFEAGDLLPVGEHRDRLLVETSYFRPPMNLYDMLERIRSGGYYPVLAHPERYVYMEKTDYRRLKEKGVEFQLNIPSLLGRYGKQVQSAAEWLDRNGFYDYRGTDIHSVKLFDK